MARKASHSQIKKQGYLNQTQLKLMIAAATIGVGIGTTTVVQADTQVNDQKTAAVAQPTADSTQGISKSAFSTTFGNGAVSPTYSVRAQIDVKSSTASQGIKSGDKIVIDLGKNPGLWDSKATQLNNDLFELEDSNGSQLVYRAKVDVKEIHFVVSSRVAANAKKGEKTAVSAYYVPKGTDIKNGALINSATLTAGDQPKNVDQSTDPSELLNSYTAGTSSLSNESTGPIGAPDTDQRYIRNSGGPDGDNSYAFNYIQDAMSFYTHIGWNHGNLAWKHGNVAAKNTKLIIKSNVPFVTLKSSGQPAVQVGMGTTGNGTTGTDIIEGVSGHYDSDTYTLTYDFNKFPALSDFTSGKYPDGLNFSYFLVANDKTTPKPTVSYQLTYDGGKGEKVSTSGDFIQPPYPGFAPVIKAKALSLSQDYLTNRNNDDLTKSIVNQMVTYDPSNNQIFESDGIKPDSKFVHNVDAKGVEEPVSINTIARINSDGSVGQAVNKDNLQNLKAGSYRIKFETTSESGNLGYGYGDLTITSSNSNNSGGGSTSSSSSSSSTPINSSSSQASSSSTPTSSSSSTTNVTIPDMGSTIAKVNQAVYSLKNIYLYKHANFKQTQRVAHYVQKPRIKRPMFVVTGYARSSAGHLRYQVKDVNHLSSTDGKTGYITANWQYVRPVYYEAKHATITVINPRGVNAYTKQNLTGKVKNYRQGTILHVAKMVHYHLTTRYVLPNGHYVTANRKLVMKGRHHLPTRVQAKTAVNRYRTANLTGRNQHYRRGHIFKVYHFDYAHGNAVNRHGALRYRVPGGYITGNKAYVKIIK